MDMLTDIIPVSPTDTPLSDETPIAAYTSYYSMAKTKINKSRLVNIRVACDRLTRVMQPGEELNFNKQVGPYRKSLGYQKAWVLINGTSVPGYGGGTCQVSSTLYNALLSLPEKQRTVILLDFWQDLPDKEIAKRMEVATRTVYNLRKRAFVAIKKYYEHHGRDP